MSSTSIILWANFMLSTTYFLATVWYMWQLRKKLEDKP